jgi:hypothetical protein
MSDNAADNIRKVFGVLGIPLLWDRRERMERLLRDAGWPRWAAHWTARIAPLAWCPKEPEPPEPAPEMMTRWQRELRAALQSLETYLEGLTH